MSPGLLPGPDPVASAEAAKLFADSGSIDPVENIAGANVYIYSGVYDTVVVREVVDATASFYSLFVNPSMGGNITTGASTNVRMYEHVYFAKMRAY